MCLGKNLRNIGLYVEFSLTESFSYKSFQDLLYTVTCKVVLHSYYALPIRETLKRIGSIAISVLCRFRTGPLTRVPRTDWYGYHFLRQRIVYASFPSFSYASPSLTPERTCAPLIPPRSSLSVESVHPPRTGDVERHTTTGP